MKKLFTSIVALSFAFAGFTALADSNPTTEATPEAAPSPVAVEAPAPAPAVRAAQNVVVPEEIVEHLSIRFPGSTVYGITREGVTYVVDLGNDTHIRYDNCFNPVCYGVHDHDCSHK